MSLFKGWAEWRSILAKLRSTSEVSGIEKNFDLIIYLLTIFVPSVWAQICFGGRYAGISFIERYVVGVVTLILICFLVWPGYVPAVLAGFLLATNIIILLNVLFLTKLSFIGPPASDERSLLLFFLNVIQAVLTFGIFYRCKLAISASKAFFQTLLVFGTIGYPSGAETIVGVQIAVDFLLLAVFLAFFVGNLRSGRPDKSQAS